MFVEYKVNHWEHVNGICIFLYTGYRNTNWKDIDLAQHNCAISTYFRIEWNWLITSEVFFSRYNTYIQSINKNNQFKSCIYYMIYWIKKPWKSTKNNYVQKMCCMIYLIISQAAESKIISYRNKLRTEHSTEARSEMWPTSYNLAVKMSLVNMRDRKKWLLTKWVFNAYDLTNYDKLSTLCTDQWTMWIKSIKMSSLIEF